MKTLSWCLWVSLFCISPAIATDLVWVGGTGAWNLAGNWSPAVLPGAADNAFVTNSGTYTVTLPAGFTASVGSLTVGGASGLQTVFIDRATLTLNGASSVNSNGTVTLSVSQSVLNGAGDLSIAGALDWQNGTVTGTGKAMVASSGQVLIGSGGVTLGRSLSNSGILSWAGGNLAFASGASLSNTAGGRVDISADGHLNGAVGTPIANAGTFRVLGGTSGTIVNAPFANSGSVQVQVAALSLNLGGTHTGSFSITAGTTLAFGGGAHSLSVSSRVSGTGTLSVSGSASLLADGIFDPGTSLSVSAGVVTLGATCDVSGSAVNLLGNNGVVLFGSAGPVANLNVSAGTLGGIAPVSVSGSLSLSGGAVTNGLVTAAGGLGISGNVTLNGETTNVLGGTLSFSRPTGEAVGTYLVTPGGLISSNYDLTFNPGTLTISKAPLSVSVNSTNKVFGTPDPAFTASYSGFVNNETVANLLGTLVFQRAPGGAVGDYLVSATGLSSSNYNIGFTSGTLTITPLPLPISVSIVVDTSTVTLSWNAVSNVTYRIQFTSGLNVSAWTDLPGDVVATASSAIKKDVPNVPARFYRILALAAGQ